MCTKVEELIERLKQFKGLDVRIVDCKYEEMFSVENVINNKGVCEIIIDSEYKTKVRY